MGKTDARSAAGVHRRATDELLLAQLLGVAPSTSPDAQADEKLLEELLLPPEPTALPRRRARRRLLLAAVALLALLACLPLGAVASSLLTIRSNVAAMRAGSGARPGVQVVTSEMASQAPPLPSPFASAPDTRGRAPGLSEQHGTPTTRATRTPRPAPAAASPAPQATPTPPSEPDVQAGDGARPLGAATASLGRSSAEPSIAPSASPSPAPEAALTVLLLGIDRRPEESGPARADSVIVARLDPHAGRVALLSFPRDLLVEIPGIGWDRINAANVYGDMYPELGGGLELSRRTVEKLLGIPIDHVVSVDFAGFISAVDALGGITVNVEREVYDAYTENHFAAGPQHMDGPTALWYSRIRFLDSDFERMRRQQAVLLAIMNRIREQNALQQLQSIAAVTGALRGYIQTDLPEDQMVRLAWGFRNLAPEAVEQYRLEVDQVDLYVNPNDPYAQYIRPGVITELVAKLVGSPTP